MSANNSKILKISTNGLPIIRLIISYIDIRDTIIKDLDIDLIGVQEIASVRSFNELLNQLDGWQGVLSNDTYGNGNYQKTAILYKTDFISISAVKNIFAWYFWMRVSANWAKRW